MNVKRSKASAKNPKAETEIGQSDGLIQLKSRTNLNPPSFAGLKRDADYLNKLSDFTPFYWYEKGETLYDIVESQSGLDGNASKRVVDVYLVVKLDGSKSEENIKSTRGYGSLGMVFSDSATGTTFFKSYYLGFKEPEYALLTGFLYVLKKAESLGLTKLRLHGHIPFLAKFSNGGYDKIDEFHQKTCHEIDKLVAKLTEFWIVKEPPKTHKLVSLATKQARLRNSRFKRRDNYEHYYGKKKF